MSDEMDEAKVDEALTTALDHQSRTILSMALLAGCLRGENAVAVKQSLREFVQAELEDTYLLVEKLSALGGSPRLNSPALDLPTDTGKALSMLMDHERPGWPRCTR